MYCSALVHQSFIQSQSKTAWLGLDLPLINACRLFPTIVRLRIVSGITYSIIFHKPLLKCIDSFYLWGCCCFGGFFFFFSEELFLVLITKWSITWSRGASLIAAEKTHGVTLWLHPSDLGLNWRKNPTPLPHAISLKESIITLESGDHVLSINYTDEVEIHGMTKDVGLFFSEVGILHVLSWQETSTIHFHQVFYTTIDTF